MSEFFRWTLLGGILTAVLLYTGCTLTRAGYQSPKYVLKGKLGKVEIRDYGEMVLAQTPSRLATEGRDGGFKRLFRYISKGNASARALPMTTPVFYRRSGEAEAMAFVLPSGGTSLEAPSPLDGAVQIVTREGGCFAVLRMQGGRSAGARQRGQEAVVEALQGSEWQLEGEAEFAFYDPPWIPSFLERNEVVWRITRR
jgi:hypothetical protein